MNRHLAHVREIEAVYEGRAQGRDPVVVESWRRCVDRHRLDPTKQGEAFIVPETQLREHRQQSEDLVRISRSGIETLYGLLAGQNYVLLLADQHGVTVEYMGDERNKAELRRSGLYLGAEWSEARAGTCALGACIESGEAVVIHQDDHFDTTHAGLSCTAAPIHDSHGRLRAVLDVSLLSSPKPKASQSLALGLVKATARRIELANLMAQSRQSWVLRLAGAPEFLDVDPEAALALDELGRIIGLTQSAAQFLGAGTGAGPGLIGRKITEFLELELDDLGQLTRALPPQDRLITARGGQAMFAHVIEPQTARPVRRARTPEVPAPLRGLAGPDEAMRALLGRAARLAPAKAPLLLTGETGVGKETLARALHEASGRTGPLIVLDCADLPDERIEELLFGRATRGGQGGEALLREAHRGTLLLDEVAELPSRVQSRLLRLLGEGCFTPLGTARPVNIDIRIIATTQHDLSARVSEGRFRKDLYYRLCGAVLELPPLRERADFAWLAYRIAAGAGKATLSPGVLELLEGHDWPGNLRELSHALGAAAVLSGSADICVDHLPDTIKPGQAAFNGEVTREAITTALAACDGNVSRAARRLGINRSTIYRRMK